MYQITNWQDHVVERPRTYTVVDNGDGSKTYTPAPGATLQQGTPMSATNLNKLEVGVLQNSVLQDLIISILMMQIRALAMRVEELEEAVAAI